MQHRGQGMCRLRRWPWLLLASGLLGGCSLVFVRQAPPEDAWPRIAWVQCNDSPLAPLADSLLAVSGGLSALAGTQAKQAVAPALTNVAIWGASAVYGWIQTSRCSELQSYLKQKADARRFNAMPAPPQPAALAPVFQQPVPQPTTVPQP